MGPSGGTDIGNPNMPNGNGGTSPQPMIVRNDPVNVTATSEGSYMHNRIDKPGSRAQALGLPASTLRNRQVSQGLNDIRQKYGSYNVVKTDGFGNYSSANPQANQEIQQVMKDADQSFVNNTQDTAKWITRDNQGNPVEGRTFKESDNPSDSDLTTDRLETGERAMGMQ